MDWSLMASSVVSLDDSARRSGGAIVPSIMVAVLVLLVLTPVTVWRKVMGDEAVAPPAVRLDWTNCEYSGFLACSTYWTPIGAPVTCRHPNGSQLPVVLSQGVFSFYRYVGGDPPLAVEASFAFGAPGDVPLCGDWDGNGSDTIGVLRGRQVLLRNSNTSGPADVAFTLPLEYTRVVTGDWNGDGKDDFLVRHLDNGSIYDVISSYKNGQTAAVMRSFRLEDWGDNAFMVDDPFHTRDSIARFRYQIGCYPSCTIYLYYSPRLDQTVPESAFKFFGHEPASRYFQGSLFATSSVASFGNTPTFIAVQERGLAR